MSERGHPGPTRRSKLLAGDPDFAPLGDELERLDGTLRQRVNAKRDNLEKGLAQLVLTLIELLRQLMERQALRRIEGGSLTPDEVSPRRSTSSAVSAPPSIRRSAWRSISCRSSSIKVRTSWARPFSSPSRSALTRRRSAPSRRSSSSPR